MIEKFALRIIHNIGTPTSIFVHTIMFILPFSLLFFGVDMDRILLVITLAVSFEAIYLSLFIQMSVNIQTKKILEGVENIQEGVEDIQEDQEEDDKEDDKDIEDIKKTINKLISINDKLLKEVIELKRQNIKK